MWAILKIDVNKFNLLNEDLRKKIGKDLSFYSPKINIQTFRNNRLVNKSVPLLGDYIFCFHQKFKSQKANESLKFAKRSSSMNRVTATPRSARAAWRGWKSFLSCRLAR